MAVGQETGVTNNKSSSGSKCFVSFAAILIGAVVGCLITWIGLHFGYRHTWTKKSHISKAIRSKPNFILFVADDTGYGDFQFSGHPNQEATGVDRMAKEGMAFTHFYTPAPICSPSRAAILTGRYPIRAGIFGEEQVFNPLSSGGLPRNEVTIAEALKQRGYTTGITGKWHLGINRHNNSDGYHLPGNHGFDVVNTILPFSQNWFCKQHHSYVPEMSSFCFLYKNNQILEQPINLGSLTTKLVTDTIEFLNKHEDGRFFYLMSFPQTHAALFADRRFAGKSKRGPYGDNINEMGWAINEVLDHIVKLGIDSETLAIFLSDHGAVRDGCGEEGSNGPFRGGKFTTWEGGVRVPAVAWWPGVIEQGTITHTVLSTLDIFPTILELANAGNGMPISNNTIDGASFLDEITKRKNVSTAVEERPLFFYCSDMLTAVRYRNYKIHYYTSDRSSNDIVNESMPRCKFEGSNRIDEYAVTLRCRNNFIKRDPPLIFNVESDSAEHIVLDTESQQYGEIIKEVSKLVKTHEASIKSVESEVDKPHLMHLQPCCNPPSCMCNFEE